VSIIFNLHTRYFRRRWKNRGGFQAADRGAIQYGGSTISNLPSLGPPKAGGDVAIRNFVAFLKEKKKFDPDERFQSDWYRFYKKMFAMLSRAEALACAGIGGDARNFSEQAAAHEWLCLAFFA